MIRAAMLFLAILSVSGCAATRGGEPVQFANPVYEGADPWITYHDGHYYFCQTKADLGLIVWKSDSLMSKGALRSVWTPPENAWNSKQVWAPELHRVRGKWYIYYAASDGENKNHRMGVLEAKTDDPQGEYIDRGMMYTGDNIETGENNRWAIDGTPLELGDDLYFIWSGWEDHNDVQFLYIAPMENPWKISGNRVRIADNDEYIWERVNNSMEERGLAEAPQVLKKDGRIFVTYSTSASWLPTYKLGLIELIDPENPLNPESWLKYDKPVFQGTDNVLGVGHASFVKSPDGTQDWIVYHTKVRPDPGWARAVHIQPFTWDENNLPIFGEPVAKGVVQQAPSGEKPRLVNEEFRDDFDDSNWDGWSLYGYTFFINARNDQLNLGGRPRQRVVNDYRSGEKVLTADYEWTDTELRCRMMLRQDGAAGALVRTTVPFVGYASFIGYHAALDSENDRVTISYSDGKELTEIAAADMKLEPKQWYELRVTAVGDMLAVWVDDEMKIQAFDDRAKYGMAGFRVANVHAAFDDVVITPAIAQMPVAAGGV